MFVGNCTGKSSHTIPEVGFNFHFGDGNQRGKCAAFIGRLGFWSGTGKISKSCVFTVGTDADLNEIAQGPYFVWVSIATVLQLSITAMNWGRS